MYVIMVYDVGTERVGRVLKVGRKYLTWVPGSTVFTRSEAHSEREKPLIKGFPHSEARQNPEIA